MNDNKAFTLVMGTLFATVLGIMGFSYADKRKHEAYMLNLPPEYFTAEAEKAKAEADRRVREYEAQKANELAKYQAKLDFEKNASPEYWSYKNSQEERDTKERIAKAENDTKVAQAAELRRALEAYTK